MRKTVDLNCDMGEGFGADEALMQHVTSVNIACGAHAGDPNVMDTTVRLAKKYGVTVGAHPGFPDIAGFGRRMLQLSPDEIYRSMVYQIGGLAAFCKVHGVDMQHVKPHGALYNLAAKDSDVAAAIARAVYDINPQLLLYGLAGGALISAGRQAGLHTASEVFADRTYQSDGALTPRSEANAMVDSADGAIKQVTTMIEKGYVEATDGAQVPIKADTICVHGDGAHAVDFAKELRAALEQGKIDVRAIL
ncbi:LamB/YcsF family protein [Virgibacillus necropolis]|uniref:LamB/YcsF family protein n=1 Tax=Virgibacillus necropolis TaxID=163877 RepID=UPI00384DC177